MTLVRHPLTRLALCTLLMGLTATVEPAAGDPLPTRELSGTAAASRGSGAAARPDRLQSAAVQLADAADGAGSPVDQAAQVSGSESGDSTSFSFDVSEHAEPGTVVGSLTPTASAGDRIEQFAIVAGNTDEAFVIDTATGRIAVNRSDAIDFEGNSRFELTVQFAAKRAGEDSLRNQFAKHLQKTGADRSAVEQLMSSMRSCTVIVEVTDVNEPPHLDSVTFQIQENSPDGEPVGTLTCTDADRDDSVTFSIREGNEQDAFRINPESGQLSVHRSAALDFETQHEYELAVEVTDSGGLSDRALVRIRLEDVDETPPQAPAPEPEPVPEPIDPPDAGHEILPPLPPETRETGEDAAAGHLPEPAAPVKPQQADNEPDRAAAPTRSLMAILAWVVCLGGLAGNGMWAFSLTRRAVSIHRRHVSLEEDSEQHKQQRRSLQEERDRFVSEQQRIKKMQAALAQAEEEFQHRKQVLESEREALEQARQDLQANRESLEAERNRLMEMQATVAARQSHAGEATGAGDVDLPNLGLDLESCDESGESSLPEFTAEFVSEQGGGPDDEQAVNLRSSLSEMFGIALGQGAAESQLDNAQTLVEQAIDTDPASAAESPSDESNPATDADTPCDTVSDYMEQFMKRYSLEWRGSEQQAAGSAKSKAAAPAEETRQPAAAPAVATAAEPDPAVEEPVSDPAPRHRLDPDAERLDLNSLREVANQAARAAVAAHSRKKVRDSTLVKGIGVFACMATSAVLFFGQFLPSNAYAWGAAAIGCVLGLDLIYSMRSVRPPIPEEEQE